MKSTDSGISYKITKKGTGGNAKDNDNVKVHYTLKLIEKTANLKVKKISNIEKY